MKISVMRAGDMTRPAHIETTQTGRMKPRPVTRTQGLAWTSTSRLGAGADSSSTTIAIPPTKAPSATAPDWTPGPAALWRNTNSSPTDHRMPESSASTSPRFSESCRSNPIPKIAMSPAKPSASALPRRSVNGWRSTNTSSSVPHTGAM